MIRFYSIGMTSNLFVPAAAVMVVVAPVTARAADTVVLTNGDHISGKVQGLAHGTLAFGSDKAGALAIPVGNLTSVTTEAPVQIVLTDGSKFSSTLQAGDAAGKVTLSKPGEPAPLVVAFSAIRWINLPVIRWTGNAAVGYATVKATTSTQTTSVTANAVRSTETARSTWDGTYLLTRAAGVTSENSTQVNGEYDFGLQQRRYGVISGSLQNDEPQQLNLRAVGGSGIGFITIQQPRLTLRTSLGLSVRSETYKNTGTKTNLSVQLGYEIDTKVGREATFHHDLTFLPQATSPADSYLRATFAVVQPLSGAFSLSIKTIFEHTSQPPAGIPENTSNLVVGLGVRF